MIDVSPRWVFSTELPQQQSAGHDIYKPSSNATKLQGYTWSISYGDGSSASGDVYTDTVSVGNVVAHNQAVEAAKRISRQFTQDQDNDGLLGLAFSSINTGKFTILDRLLGIAISNGSGSVKPKAQTTFFDTVKSQLDSPLFAVTLKHNAPGSYDFGYIDNKKYTGKITYTDVDSSQGFWGFTASGYGVGDGEVNSNPIKGIAGTSSRFV